MSRCRSCDAEIAWVKLASGTLAPVNGEHPQAYRIFPTLQPGAGKRLTLINERGVTLTGYAAPKIPGDAPSIVVTGWESHFATCPEREAWRRR